MSFSRYDNRRIMVNDNSLYSELFGIRNVNFIRQYETPKFKYPTTEEIQTLNVIGHLWVMGDNLAKLAEKYYGEPEYHWLIAFYNLKIEPQIKLGDVIYIPLPLEKILRYIGV